MPNGTQSKILRVLTEQQFQRVGGADNVRVDLRVISSTTRSLEQEVDNGNFRQELFHRLNVVPIDVPSLSERREDVPELATYFIEAFNKAQGLPLRVLSGRSGCHASNNELAGNVTSVEEHYRADPDSWCRQREYRGQRNFPAKLKLRTKKKVVWCFPGRLRLCHCAKRANCSNGNTC